MSSYADVHVEGCLNWLKAVKFGLKLHRKRILIDSDVPVKMCAYIRRLMRACVCGQDADVKFAM
jgi:hypothetical protein